VTMGLVSLIKRLKARLRPGAVVADVRPIPRLELWELWEGVGEEALRDVVEGIREGVAEDVEGMQEAYRQPN